MIIRKAQMDAMSDYVFDSFVRRMLVHLRAKCQERTAAISDAELDKFVRAGVGRAHSFNVRSEPNLVTFLEFAAQYGLDYYTTTQFTGALGALEDGELNETEKMNRVNEYLIFR